MNTIFLIKIYKENVKRVIFDRTFNRMICLYYFKGHFTDAY